jgi:hypothetical protein
MPFVASTVTGMAADSAVASVVSPLAGTATGSGEFPVGFDSRQLERATAPNAKQVTRWRGFEQRLEENMGKKRSCAGVRSK